MTAELLANAVALVTGGGRGIGKELSAPASQPPEPGSPPLMSDIYR